MSIYPRLIINKSKIEHNAKLIKAICDKHNIDIAAVTKVFCGIIEISKIYNDVGIKIIADSRLENLNKINFPTTKMLLRIPMLSEIHEVAKHADIVLISELETIKKLNEATNKKMDIIIMIDLGDLREGIFDKKDLDTTLAKTLKLKNIDLKGFGTNLSCYGGVLPTEKNMNQFINLIENLENKYSFKSEIISGGNFGAISMIDKLPKRINNLRVGASITLGIGLNDEPIEGASQDAFILEAEVVELKWKPSVPIGETGLDAFGNKPVFKDDGDIKRAICAIGRQDVNPDNIIPLIKGVKVLGVSSDHLLLDVTHAEENIELGSVIKFNLGYGGVLSLATSNYVKKVTK